MIDNAKHLLVSNIVKEWGTSKGGLLIKGLPILTSAYKEMQHLSYFGYCLLRDQSTLG